MNFSTDSYYHIGAAHLTAGKPCQDYAASHSFSDDSACAVVSDGCSTGGRTDIGARILALATIESIARNRAKTGCNVSPTFIKEESHDILLTVEDQLGLLPEDMLATCLYCYLDQHGGFVHLQGDGVVALKYKHSGLVIHRFDWAKNAPYYPSYSIQDASRYIAMLHSGNPETAVLSQVIASKNESGAWEESRVDIPIAVAAPGYKIEVSLDQAEALEFVAVFSDGVTQIGKVSGGEGMLNWRDMVTEFMSFKTTAGDFAKRRMLRGIRDLHKTGNGPIDDIGYAVIHIQPQVSA